MALASTDVSRSVTVASFGDLDLVASAGALAVAWTPPESDAGIETYVTYLAAGATGAAGSGGALAGRRAVGTKVFTVSSDTGSAGKSHFMVHPKFMLAELTAPVALAPTDVSKSVSAVSFGDLDLDADAVALAVPWTPPEDSTVSIETYELYLARTLRRASPLFPSTIGACTRTMRVAACPGLRRRTTRVSRPT